MGFARPVIVGKGDNLYVNAGCIKAIGNKIVGKIIKDLDGHETFKTRNTDELKIAINFAKKRNARLYFVAEGNAAYVFKPLEGYESIGKSADDSLISMKKSDLCS